MVSFILSAIALALSAAAAPTSTATAGVITYYDPGVGACGWHNSDVDHVVGVSAAVFNSIHPCGRLMTVSANGRSVTVKVVERCDGCPGNDLELSKSAFQILFGSLGTGRANANWQWV